MAVSVRSGYHDGMEGLVERLKAIGTDAQTIAEILLNGEEETALVLIALFDDRHEYVD